MAGGTAMAVDAEGSARTSKIARPPRGIHAESAAAGLRCAVRMAGQTGQASRRRTRVVTIVGVVMDMNVRGARESAPLGALLLYWRLAEVAVNVPDSGITEAASTGVGGAACGVR